ncbi:MULTISPECIES: ALQxL family class IV lanthipeptide [unclassified Streptomyces]|uniref:ALQxL family class IV lanthipeptide n=1 Tax=Streptomyces sp. NBC_00060 TaxID=2975636 RepID=A0AAU2HDD0_9ACTN
MENDKVMEADVTALQALDADEETESALQSCAWTCPGTA